MKAVMNHNKQLGVETVPFEQLNCLPCKANLKEYHEEILPGHQNSWYVYAPACYSSAVPAPLIVQVHGGGADGVRCADCTSWHLLAEKYGFLVAYPNSLCPGTWNCDDDDIEWLKRLILRMEQMYSIDPERIYMTGISNGDMMTLAFSMAHPEMLAAAAFITGPSCEEALEDSRPTSALPIIQMRGELDVNWQLTPETKDVYKNRYEMNDLNRAIWEDVNGTREAAPALSIRGKDNYLFYPGKNAPLVNWEIKSMGHREPIYSAAVLWERLFSGCRRSSQMCCTDHGAVDPILPDKDLIILAVGSRKAWVGDHVEEISSEANGIVRVVQPGDAGHFCPVPLGEMGETEAYYAPVDMLGALWNANVQKAVDGRSVQVTLKDGRKLSLYENSLLYQLEDRWLGLQKPCLHLYGSFYFPVEELLRNLFPCHITSANDTICISGHYADLGRYTARILNRLLGGYQREQN